MLTLEIDSRRLSAALTAFMRYSRRSQEQVLREVAKGFVRRVVAISAPAQGKADTQACKRGEQAVATDLRKIFTVVDQRKWLPVPDGRGGARLVPLNKGNRARGGENSPLFMPRSQMADFHRAHRHGQGHTRPLGDHERAIVPKDAFAWYLKEAQREVGGLAAGWLASATALGYRPPQWISRHGDARGRCVLDFTEGKMQIRIDNNVPYSNEVRGFQRSVQTALDQQARSLERRVAYFLERDARRARQ